MKIKQHIIILVLMVYTVASLAQNRSQNVLKSSDLNEEVLAKLDLKPQDAAKLKTQHAVYSNKMKKVRKEAQGDREKMQASAKIIREEHLKQVADILDDRQLKLYSASLSQKSGSRAGGGRGAGIEKLKKELNLDAEQEKKFNATQAAYQEMAKNLRQKHEGNRQAFMNAMKPLREKREQMLQSFLTADQFSKYKKASERSGGGHHH